MDKHYFSATDQCLETTVTVNVWTHRRHSGRLACLIHVTICVNFETSIKKDPNTHTGSNFLCIFQYFVPEQRKYIYSTLHYYPLKYVILHHISWNSIKCRFWRRAVKVSLLGPALITRRDALKPVEAEKWQLGELCCEFAVHSLVHMGSHKCEESNGIHTSSGSHRFTDRAAS